MILPAAVWIFNLAFFLIKNNEVCGHEYGSPIESVKKCLNATKNIRYPKENESFVKYTCQAFGFGNRLFVYLSARAAAYRFNKTLLHVRHPDAAVLLSLNFDPNCLENFSDEVVLDKVQFHPHHNNWLEYNNQILEPRISYEVGGYMQSQKYTDFPNVREKIWNGLEFQESKITESADSCIRKYNSLQASSAPLVCAHIRLGDKFGSYRNPDETLRYDDQNQYSHWVPNGDYMRAGIQWFDKTLMKAHYLVLSDTMSRVRRWNLQQYTRNNVTLLDDLHCRLSPLAELSLLFDHCDHLLLTAGTFGIWAGWKSKGHVLMSKLQYVTMRLNKTFFTAQDEESYFPPNVRLLQPCKGELDRFCEVSEARDPHWNDWKKDLVPGRNIKTK
mmetsp:Transcript_20610/g.29520  ORF Transcript_20610/g.29520 Transcript_20610/m.29520 type:complete len:387 (-) Transcript_20610:66-1226(-)